MRPYANFKVDSKLAALLGENYRSSEDAIKELVDNSWDADSGNVWITLPDPLTSDPIVVEDDGSGMTSREVRNEYLMIANDRRSRKGEVTPLKKRKVKGRKGIGKFAGLMATNIMELETKARGENTKLTITKSNILNAKKDLEKIDLPVNESECNYSEHGTILTLSGLNQKFSFPNPNKLKRILILDYGRQTNFQIFVNGVPLDIEDIPGKTYEEKVELPNSGKVNLKLTISENKKKLKQSGIAIRVGGKIVGRPSYFGLEDDESIPKKLLGGVYGEIDADSLIDDVTADWGAIIENSNAYQEMKEWAYSKLKEKVTIEFSREVNLQKRRLQKEINKRLEKLPEYRREYASMALERALKRFYGESEEKINVVISVMLEAFERDEYWVVLQNIDKSKHQDIETFAEALDDFGFLDMALMAKQASGRLEFLDNFEELIKNKDTLEKTIHKALEKNLWVLGTEYSTMSSNITLARVIDEYTGSKFTGDRANKRPDLFLSHNVHNQYLLIEFKRPSHTLSRDDENQAEKYRDDLTSKFGRISVIVLGKQKSSRISEHYSTEDIQLLSYDSIVSNARTQLNWLISELIKHQHK